MNNNKETFDQAKADAESHRISELAGKDQSYLVDQVMEDLELSNKFPLVIYDEIGNTIDLADVLHENGKNYKFRHNPYWIDFGRIDTELKLLWWIKHLLDKDWFTKDHIEQLLWVWSEKTGTRINF